MMNRFEHILNQLPYTVPFLFVDQIDILTDNGVEGKYTFNEDAFFYKGHFKGNPVTPGVILTECMAQIGVVCLGIHLKAGTASANTQIALSHHAVDFYIPVFPGETVTVISEKEYFRFQKLKCRVKMMNAAGELVCRGVISGMMVK
jgi:3-hydroxyacyl-[acyl-carrier-protein] dehydratase